MEHSTLDRLIIDISNRKPVALVTWLSSDNQQLVYREDNVDDNALALAIDEGFRTDRSKVVKISGEDVFVNIYNPPLRMVIIGAVHIAQALIPMATQAGYDVIVVDPRTAFASAQRFAGVARDTRWPEEALPDIELDQRTAIVALTHDPKIDDPSLHIALQSGAFYVGALGSKRTHTKRLDRLKSAGLSAHQLALLKAPIGLDIGAIGSVEIAISIMAEITAALRGKLHTNTA